MRWLSFIRDGEESFGVVVDSGTGPGLVDVGVVDVGQRHPEYVDLKHVLADQALDELGAQVSGLDADCSLDAIEFLPVITAPDKILCAAMLSHGLADYIGGGLDKFIAFGVTVVIVVCFEVVDVH